MGSGADMVHETVDYMVEQGERVGIVKVRLYRPFSIDHLMAALPGTVKTIAVLDRTKEPGGRYHTNLARSVLLVGPMERQSVILPSRRPGFP